MPTLVLNGISPHFDNNDDTAITQEIAVNFACDNSGNKKGALNCSVNKFILCFNSSSSTLVPISGIVRNFSTAEIILTHKCVKCQVSQKFSFEVCTSGQTADNNGRHFAAVSAGGSAFENVSASFSRDHGVELMVTYKCRSCSETAHFSIDFGDNTFLGATTSKPYKIAANGKSVLEGTVGRLCSKCHQFCSLDIKLSEQQATLPSEDGGALVEASASSNNDKDKSDDDCRIIVKSERLPQLHQKRSPAVELHPETQLSSSSSSSSSQQEDEQEDERPKCHICLKQFNNMHSLRCHYGRMKGKNGHPNGTIANIIQSRICEESGDKAAADDMMTESTTSSAVVTPPPSSSSPSRKIRHYCSFCPRNYCNVADKRKHERELHPNELAQQIGAAGVKCPACRAVFENVVAMKAHKRCCKIGKLLENSLSESNNEADVQSDE